MKRRQVTFAKTWLAIALAAPLSAQDSTYGNLSVSARAVHEDSGADVYETLEFYGSGTNRVRAYDESAFGSRAHADAIASSDTGRIGIAVTSEAMIPGKNQILGTSGASAVAYLAYHDVIWFYSTQVTYATPLKLHLRGQLNGWLNGRSDGATQHTEASFSGRGEFQFAVEDAGPDSSVLRSLEMRFDGSETVITGNRDPYFDLWLEVPNTPNRHYDLRMSALFEGTAYAFDDGFSDFGTAASYEFQFANSLSWVGLVSAETLYGGEPVRGVQIGSRSMTDYNRSYAPPLPSVPEPATYALGSVLLTALGILRKRRWRERERKAEGRMTKSE